jgi:ClpA/ClpB-like protein
VDLPLSSASKRALTFAAEEADLLFNERICTEHILLGLLREEKDFAAQILGELGVRLQETRGDLVRLPHNESKTEEFVRERAARPKDVADLQSRIRSIRGRMEEAIANHDFTKARAYSDEEGKERDNLFLQYQKYGLIDWIYD